ncbi:cupin domain-containing protein [Spirosoma koreense]
MKTTAARINLLILIWMTTSVGMAQTQLLRKDLLQVLLTKQSLSQIDIKQVTLPAGQAAPTHMHPCPVVGYVVSGSVLFQIEGEEKRVIHQGEAFYEPKDKVILHFDNGSPQEPLTFIAFYLKEADEALIKLVK